MLSNAFKQVSELFLAHAIEVLRHRELPFQRTKPWREMGGAFVLIDLLSHQLKASNGLEYRMKSIGAPRHSPCFHFCAIPQPDSFL